MGGWHNDQEALKPREVQPALASVIQRSSLRVCQSHICSVSQFTVVCQRKIGNKNEWEKEKTRKQTYQRQIRAKVDHVTDCVPPCPRYITSGIHTVCAMIWLGVKHAESALEGADWPHYEWLPLRMLRSRGGELSLRREFSWASSQHLPRWRGGWRELRGAPIFFLPIRSSARFLRLKTRPAVLPTRERARSSACLFPKRGTGRMSMNFHKRYVCTSMLGINKNK